jgi:outer membrane protein
LILLVPVSALSGQERDLQLEDFLGLVEQNSLELVRARTDTRIAGRDEFIARSATLPMVSAQAGYTRNLMDLTTEVPVYAVDTPAGIYPLEYEEIDINPDNEISLGLNVQQLLFDMRVFRALEASKEFSNLTSVRYETIRQTVLTEAKKLFYRALLLVEVLDVRRASEELAYENYMEVRERRDAGIASPLDLLRAELNWKTTIPETSQANRNLQVALTRLKNLAGIEPEERVRPAGNLLAYPQLPETESLGTVLGQRPDYQALQRNRNLHALQVAAERAEFYPRLSASFMYGWSASDNEFQFDDPTEVSSLGVTLTVPLFSGGSRIARLSKAGMQLDQAETDILKKIDDIRTEIDTIQLMLLEAEERIQSASQTLETADLAYSITETSVEAGVSTQLELKDARVSLVSARLTYFNAIFDYLSAYFEWQAVTGHGADGLERIERSGGDM